MKTLKKAEQKNVELNTSFYTSDEIDNMLLAHEIFYINKFLLVLIVLMNIIMKPYEFSLEQVAS